MACLWRITLQAPPAFEVSELRVLARNVANSPGEVCAARYPGELLAIAPISLNTAKPRVIGCVPFPSFHSGSSSNASICEVHNNMSAEVDRGEPTIGIAISMKSG